MRKAKLLSGLCKTLSGDFMDQNGWGSRNLQVYGFTQSGEFAEQHKPLRGLTDVAGVG
jgi:hypothetical protein